VKLVVVSGEVKTKELSIKLPSTIGRGRATAVILPHPLVSRNHCELFETDGRLMVRDLGSLNGTYVNNERVTEAPLDPGDSLTVGTVTFRAEYDALRQPDDEPKTRMIKKKSEKTVRVNKDGSPVARPKSQPIVEESDDELLDVDFGQSLFASEEPAPGGAGHATQRMPRKDADDQAKTPAKGNKAVSPSPQGNKGPAKPNKPAPKPPAKPKPADSDSGGLSSSSDDGLDDFLKDLKK